MDGLDAILLMDCGVGGVGCRPSARGFPQRPLFRVGSFPGVVSLHALLGQHDQVVAEHGQSDRSLKMLKSAVEAPRQPKRPF